jgi:signal peptidase I
MAEAITAEMGEATPSSGAPRRLHPGVAFLCGLLGLGLGYVYVGRLAYAIVFILVAYLWLLGVAWTGLSVDPVGWYARLVIVALMWLVQLVHPVALAWSRPVAQPKAYNRWWCYLGWIVALEAASLLVSADRARSYYIPSGAMLPTVQPGDRVVVDTWRYRDAAPAVGDVVICEFDEGTLVVKRVVGVPGDTVELRGALLIRNGNPIDEPYLNAAESTTLPDFAPLTLRSDEFFVLGDYRSISNDSRHRGPLARDQIYGRVEFVAYSRSSDRFALVLAPD